MNKIAKPASVEDAEINHAKNYLATEIAALLHSRQKAEKAAETAQLAFANARRSVKGGSVRVNHKPVSNEKMMVDSSFPGNDGKGNYRSIRRVISC